MPGRVAASAVLLGTQLPEHPRLTTVRRRPGPRARRDARSFHVVFAISGPLLIVMHVHLSWREPLGLASAALLVLLWALYAIEPLWFSADERGRCD